MFRPFQPHFEAEVVPPGGHIVYMGKLGRGLDWAGAQSGGRRRPLRWSGSVACRAKCQSGARSMSRYIELLNENQSRLFAYPVRSRAEHGGRGRPVPASGDGVVAEVRSVRAGHGFRLVGDSRGRADDQEFSPRPATEQDFVQRRSDAADCGSRQPSAAQEAAAPQRSAEGLLEAAAAARTGSWWSGVTGAMRIKEIADDEGRSAGAVYTSLCVAFDRRC